MLLSPAHSLLHQHQQSLLWRVKSRLLISLEIHPSWRRQWWLSLTVDSEDFDLNGGIKTFIENNYLPVTENYFKIPRFPSSSAGLFGSLSCNYAEGGLGALYVQKLCFHRAGKLRFGWGRSQNYRCLLFYL